MQTDKPRLFVVARKGHHFLTVRRTGDVWDVKGTDPKVARRIATLLKNKLIADGQRPRLVVTDF